MSDPLVLVENVHKVYQSGSHSVNVLRGVDLSIREGKTCVVLGRSGCGKSVLLKHLIGLFKPTSGRVFIEGQDITDLPERRLLEVRRKVGMLFQSAALFDSMTVEQNISFPLREQGIRDPQILRERVTERPGERVSLRPNRVHFFDAGTGRRLPS